MFQPLKGNLQGVHLVHSSCTCVPCTVAAICCGTQYTPHIKLNCTDGDSFCCLCCSNVSHVLPEDDPLRVETWWSDIYGVNRMVPNSI